MNKAFVIGCVLLFACQSLPSGEPAIQNRLIGIDALGYIYTIEQDYFLNRSHIERSVDQSFRRNSLGKLASVDFSDPFKILCYYPDQSTLIMLDQDLGELKAVRYDAEQFGEDLVFCRERNGRIWFYDHSKQRLFQTTENLEEVLASQQLMHLGSNFRILGLAAGKENLYARTSDGDVHIFSSLGRYERKLFFKNVNTMTAQKDSLYLQMEGGDWYRMHPNDPFAKMDTLATCKNCAVWQGKPIEVNRLPSQN